MKFDCVSKLERVGKTNVMLKKAWFMKVGALAIGVSVAGLAGPASASSFFGDTIDARIDNFLPGMPIDSSATVGAGVEFVGSTLFHDYSLDIADTSFTLTVSKPSSAGNFTGIFDSIVLDNIDRSITSVTLDSLASSTFSNGLPLTVDLSVPGRIELECSFFCSANTPPTALSQSFTWNVAFAEEVAPVPEPLGLVSLFAFGAVAAGSIAKRKILHSGKV